MSRIAQHYRELSQARPSELRALIEVDAKRLKDDDLGDHDVPIVCAMNDRVRWITQRFEAHTSKARIQLGRLFLQIHRDAIRAQEQRCPRVQNFELRRALIDAVKQVEQAILVLMQDVQKVPQETEEQ